MHSNRDKVEKVVFHIPSVLSDENMYEVNSIITMLYKDVIIQKVILGDDTENKERANYIKSELLLVKEDKIHNFNIQKLKASGDKSDGTIYLTVTR